MLVKDFMTTNLYTCKESDTVETAAKTMFEKHVSVLPIVDEENRLKGILTESDFIGKEVDIPHALVSLKMLFGKVYHLDDIEDVYKKARSAELKGVMSRKIVTVKPESAIDEVVDLMVTRHLKRLPVVENDKLVGIITRRDILTAYNTL